MPRFRVGVHLRPQHTTVRAMRDAWKAADALGVDVITTWDHFYPLSGDPDGVHFECFSLLAAMAVETSRVQLGPLVSSITYRNPDLLADMARTIDHLSGGRFICGVGAGYFEKDHREYGYELGTPGSRLKLLAESLPRIKARLAKLNPPPLGRMPIMIGGGGERVTLKLAAQHADMWNAIAEPEVYAHKNRVLNDWCAKVGRDPASIERSTNIPQDAIGRAEEWLAAGAQLLMIQTGHPFDLKPAEALLGMARY